MSASISSFQLWHPANWISTHSGAAVRMSVFISVKGATMLQIVQMALTRKAVSQHGVFQLSWNMKFARNHSWQIFNSNVLMESIAPTFMADAMEFQIALILMGKQILQMKMGAHLAPQPH
jgi:hypothetical protein